MNQLEIKNMVKKIANEMLIKEKECEWVRNNPDPQINRYAEELD